MTIDAIIEIILFIASLAITAASYVLAPRPKNENARPPALGQFTFPTATEGRPIPIIYGTNSIKGPNVVWYGDLKSAGVVESGAIIGFQYFVGVQFGLCMGEVDGLLSIYVNSTLVWSGWQDTDGQFNIVAGRIFGGFGGGSSGGIGAFPEAPDQNGQFFFYKGGTSPTANPYLAGTLGSSVWLDDFTFGQAGESLNNFQGSDPGTWYRVSKGSTALTYNPTTPDLVDDIMQTYAGTQVGDLMPNHVAMERFPYPTVPDYTNVSFTAVLTNPDAPPVTDNFSASLIFRPRTNVQSSGITNYDTIWYGVMVDNSDTPTNQQGIFVSVSHDDTVMLIIQGPTGTVLFSRTFTAPTDFGTLSNGAANLWGLRLLVQGDAVTLYVHGNVNLGNYTKPLQVISPGQKVYSGAPVSGLHGALDALTGVCIGGQAYFNSPNSVIGVGPVDFSDNGIYLLSYDILGRQVVADFPSWPGICYGVFQKGYIGTSSQPFPWAFEVRRCPNGLALGSGMELVNATGNFADANPANILYEIITDPDWGLAMDPATVDVANFTAAATTLFDEGNGMSILIDSLMPISDFIAEIERQTYGYVFVNNSTGLWNIVLMRGGYIIADLPVIDDTNVVEITQFSHGTWDETSNNIRVAFIDRGNQYSATYAQAQDMANVAVQGCVVTSESNYPGVKDVNLANQIAWRDLRLQSTPLAVATIVVTRALSATQIGDVLAWTDTDRGISQVPMRVISVDLGKLEDGKITLKLTQDVFFTPIPSFAPPGGTQSPPENGGLPINVPIVQAQDPLLAAAVDGVHLPPAQILITSRTVFEAPYQMDRLFGKGVLNQIFTAATSVNGPSQFDVWISDGGAYSDVATVTMFATEGKLSSSLGVGGNGSSVVVLADQSGYGDILSSLQNAAASYIGSTLVNLALIDSEFILFETFSGDGTNITLNNVWRGVMDTAPAAHASNAQVWFIVGGISNQTYATGDNVSVKLLPKNLDSVGNLGLSPVTPIVMAGRATMPYPPANLDLNGLVFPASVSLDVPQVDHTESFYSLSGTPTITSSTAGTKTLGHYFTVSANGWLTGIAVYFGAGYTTNTVKVDLWTGAGTKIIEATSSVTALTAPGWVEVLFPNPVYLLSATTYVVSYTAASSLSQTKHTAEFASPVTVGDITVTSGGSVASSGTPVFPVTTDTNSYELNPIFVKESLQSLDSYGLAVSWIRRDYRNTNETAAYSESSLPADFPANNGTEYQINLFNDPLGANTNIDTVAYFNGNSHFYSRTLLLKEVNAIPSELAAVVGTQHSFPQVAGGSLTTASQNLATDFAVTSNLSNIHSYGVLAANTGSGTYTATSTGTFTLHIGTAEASGNVQVSINGGAYSTVIAATNTTGTFSVTSGQTIAVKSTQTGSPTLQTMMLMTDGTGLQVAWSVLKQG